MNSSDIKNFIKEVFANTIEDMTATEKIYEKYFSKDYIQYVDGKTLDYDDFIAHMKAQKNTLKSAKITFKYIIVEGDIVATVHKVNATKKDGAEIEAQVNALIEIKDNKIVLCDELTYLLKGANEDKDIGSRK
jgi:ketosteroid isomerase-like protein